MLADTMRDERQPGWFWDYNDIFDSDLSHHAMLVRLFLARSADVNGASFPSVKTIADKCKIGRATVFRAIDELIEKGWLERRRRMKQGRTPGKRVTDSNLYILKGPQGGLRQRPVSHRDGGGVSEGDRGGLTQRRGVVSERDSKDDPLEGLPIKDNHNKDTPLNPPQEDPVREFFDHWCEVWEGTYRRRPRLTDKRRNKIRTRLKTFSLDELKEACDNLRESKWHLGHNDRGWVADIDFLIANDERVDKWANNPPITHPQVRGDPNARAPTFDPYDDVERIAREAEKHAEQQRKRQAQTWAIG